MKDRVQLVSQMFAALAHPNRIRVVEMLRGGEHCQCHLPEALGIEQSNVSRHIKILISAGVITSRRDGVRVLLSIADPQIFDFIDAASEMVHSQLREHVSRLEKST